MYVSHSTSIREVLYNSQVSIYVCMFDFVCISLCMYACVHIHTCTYMRIAGHLSGNISNKMAKTDLNLTHAVSITCNLNVRLNFKTKHIS